MGTRSIDNAPKMLVKPFKTIDIALSTAAALITAVAMVAMKGIVIWSVAYWSPVIGAAFFAGASIYVLCGVVPRIWNCFSRSFGTRGKIAEPKDLKAGPKASDSSQKVATGNATPSLRAVPTQDAPTAAAVTEHASMPTTPAVEDKTNEIKKREFLDALFKEKDRDHSTWIVPESFSANIALFQPEEIINEFLFRRNEAVFFAGQAGLSQHSFVQLIHHIGVKRDLFEKLLSEALSKENTRDIEVFERIRAVKDSDPWIYEAMIKVFKQKILQPGAVGSAELDRLRHYQDRPGQPIFKCVIQALTQEEIAQCLDQKKICGTDFEVFRYEQYLVVLDKMALEEVLGLLQKTQPNSLAFKRMLAWFGTQSKITAQSFNSMKQQDLIVIYKKCRQEKTYLMQNGDKQEYRAKDDWDAEKLKNTTEVTNGLAKILLDNLKMQFFQGKLLRAIGIVPDVVGALSVDELYEHKDKLQIDHYGHLTTQQFEGWANRATFADLWSILHVSSGVKTHPCRVLAYICSNKSRFENDVAGCIEQLTLDELDKFYKKCSVHLYAGKNGKICVFYDLPRDMRGTDPVQDTWVLQCILQGIRTKFEEVKDVTEKEKLKTSPWFAKLNDKG